LRESIADQQVGDNFSETIEVTVTSDGSEINQIEGATLLGPRSGSFDVEDSDCAGEALPTETECVIEVRLPPTTTGARIANLAFESNAVSGDLQVALSGTGGRRYRVPGFRAFLGYI